MMLCPGEKDVAAVQRVHCFEDFSDARAHFFLGTKRKQLLNIHAAPKTYVLAEILLENGGFHAAGQGFEWD